jgi:lambda family phage portal protein
MKSLKNAHSNGPNNEIGPALTKLRDRSRHFVRNNGWAKRAQGAIASAVIGEGIRPTPVGTKNQIKAIKKIWKLWAETTACDWDGKNTFYGLQELIMREIVEAGDCLIIRRRIIPTQDNPIPIQLQILESDQLDHTRNGANDNGYCRLGVQYNADGKITGYWVWSQHPNDMAVSLKMNSELIGIDDIIHPFEVLRAGQSRGVPMGVSAFLKLSDFSDYEDAQLVRQKIAAAFSAFVKNGAGEDGNKPDQLEHIEAGIIQYLAPDEEITFSDPPAAEGYGEYSKKILQGIAAAYEITYEMLTMDYSNVNFTSGRMAKIDVSGRFRKLQYNMMVPQVCVKVWDWFMRAVIMAGIQSTYISCNAMDWTAPRVQQLDPVKETNARIAQVNAGFTTISEILREDGYDPDDVFEEIKRERAKLTELGITFGEVQFAPSETKITENV